MNSGISLLVPHTVSIREVKEVRAGPHSKDFDYHKEGLKDVEEECCFVVLYGMEFNLRTLSIAGESLVSFPDCIASKKLL